MCYRSWRRSCGSPRTVHRTLASDDGTLSDHSRTKHVYCIPPSRLALGRIDPNAAAIAAFAAAAAAWVAAAFHPAKKSKQI